MDQQNQAVTAERMRLIFEEWLKRSLDNRIMGPRLHYYSDGIPVSGEAYAAEFVKIAAELDAESKLPLPRGAASVKPAAEPKNYFNIDDVPDGYSVQQVSRNKHAVVEKDEKGIRIARCQQVGISGGLQLVYPNAAKALEVCQWLKDNNDPAEDESRLIESRVRSVVGERAAKLTEGVSDGD